MFMWITNTKKVFNQNELWKTSQIFLWCSFIYLFEGLGVVLVNNRLVGD